MKFLIGFLKGLFIGMGAIAPGVSGGSLAVIFGIYERITDLISNVFKNFKENFIFFLPIGIGGVVGVLGFSRVMDYLFTTYNAQVKYLFIGLIIGTFPTVFRQANQKGFRKGYLIPFFITLVVTLIVTALDDHAINVMHTEEPGILLLILYGAILGFGTIIPGISASFILMYLGAYQIILSSIANIDLYILIPVGVGFILSIVIFAKFINFLFKKTYGYTYYAILGFVVGSIVPIFPGFAFRAEYLVCILLLVGGFLVSYLLGKVKKEEKAQPEVI